MSILPKHKIVINSCFGGFNISGKATKRLAELGCEKAKDFIEKCDNDLSERTQEEILFDEEYPDPDPYNSMIFNKDRMNPLLFQVMEELGKDVNSVCSKLEVVYFSGDKYQICEYDGKEHIETPQDIKWKTV